MAGARISRRSMLGSAGAASLMPVLGRNATAASSAASPELPQACPAFDARLQVGAAMAGHDGGHWAAITGGSIEGRDVSGRVTGGRIEWQQQQGVCTVSARFDVLRADGTRVEVCERGQCAAMAGPFAASAEVLDAVGTAATAALLVGRMDATHLAAGAVRVQAFEVS